MAMTLRQQASQGFDARRNGRPNVGSVRITEELNPVARSAEAFVQAAPAETFSATGELARSLGALGGQLQGLVTDSQRRAKEDEEETQRAAAERAYIENNGIGFSEAVREGKIPAQASPIFQRTYQEQQGATLGRTGVAAIEQEYEKWERKDTATPEEFTGWMAERVKEKFANADPFALRAALPHIQRLQDRLSSRNVKEVSDRFYSGAIETAQQEVRAVIDQELKEPDANAVGPFLPPQINATRAARTIEGITGRLKAAGVRGADLNAAVVDTISEEAVRRNDPTLLDILKRDRENGTPGPGLTSYGQKKLAEAEDRIYRNVERLETAAARRQEREFKQGNRLATRHVVDTLFRNPEAEIDPNVIELGSRHDPDFAMKVERIREQIQKRNETDTPSEVRDATRRIWESDRPTAAVMDEVANGNIRNPATMRSLLNDAARIEQARGRGGGSSNLDAFKRTREAIAKATDPYNTNARDPDQINSRAVFDFELAMAEWDQRNPEATAVERMKQIKEVGDVYLGAISKDTGEYTTPDRAARTGTQADSQATQEGQRRLTRPAPQVQGEAPSQPTTGPDLSSRALGTQAQPVREMVLGQGGAVSWMERRIQELEEADDAEPEAGFQTRSTFNSRHYDWKDLRNDRFTGAKIAERTVKALDTVTDEFGKRLKLNSGYRSSEYNNRVSNSGDNSQHVQGTALDVNVADYSDEEKAKLAALFIREGARGLGFYTRGFMHVDFRKSSGRGPGGLAVWGQGETPTWFLQGMRDGLSARSNKVR